MTKARAILNSIAVEMVAFMAAGIVFATQLQDKVQ
jgi:hypothetical protein